MLTDSSLTMLINEQPVPDCAYCSQPISAGQVVWNSQCFHQNCAREVMDSGPSVDCMEASQLGFKPGQWPSEFTHEGKVYQLAHVQYVCGMDVLQVLSD